MPTLYKTDTENNNNGDFNNRLLNSSKSNEVVDIASRPVAEYGGYVDPKSNSGNPSKGNKQKKRFSFGKVVSLLLIIASLFLISGGAYLGYSVMALNDSSLGQGSELSFWEQLGRLGSVFNPNSRVPVKGEAEGRTNILLIGKDATGEGLTDTIIIGSYFYNEHKFVTLNIPRDFYVYDGYGSYKINSVYAYAENRQQGNGEAFLANFIGKEFGIDIHYWASIDFEGVEKIIDELGGVEVEVDNGFTDCEFPTKNYGGYIRPCPSFEKGTQTMDGEKALIYARSRKGNNGEGSDFARSRRQSIILEAVAQKAKSQNLAINATKANSYLDIVGSNFKTNVRLDEMLSAAQLRDQFDPKDDFLRVVWDTENGILCPGDSIDGAYIIQYCGGAVAGRNQNSKARNEARAIVQDLLVRATLSELFSTKVVFLGNLSNLTNEISGEFTELGFSNVRVNNNFRGIIPATLNSEEKVTVYIADDNLRSLFENMEDKPKTPYSVKKDLPTNITVPSNFTDAQVIVVIEPKSGVPNPNTI